MTASTAGPARWRARAPDPINWAMVGVLATLATVVAGGAGAWAALDRRVEALEAANPPGMLQRIDERTLQIQQALQRLEERRP